MRRIKLTRQEKEIEDSLLRGEYIREGGPGYDEIVKAIAARKKDAVLNIRVNGQDLKAIKEKALKLGIRYQTFISEILHKIAQAS